MKFYSLFVIITLHATAALGQHITGTIRGSVIDEASKAPLAYANIVIDGSNPIIGTTTDMQGHFTLSNVPVGRHDIRVSYIGYEPTLVREVLVTSGKEVFLQIMIRESVIEMSEVVVTPKVDKELPLNRMATASARLLSVEEAVRYAGGVDDPARLASSFAGVASTVRSNSIVVRGNAPKFLQWKMEGIEISNPNHFADISAFGGGGLTALSSQLLANSDFLTGAFPAEYGNALSGIFDIRMRQGNNHKHKQTFQIGVVGIDAAAEGPLTANRSSSYLFNYRYSTLSLLTPLLPEDAEGTMYTDLSFKLHFPTAETGTFSIWGIGLYDRSGATAETDTLKWVYFQDKEEQDVKQFMGAGGVNHLYFFSNTVYLSSSLATTVNGIDLFTERMSPALNLQPQNRIKNTLQNFVFSSMLNTKFSASHTNKTGFVATGMRYELLLQDAGNGGTFQTLVDETGSSVLLNAFTSSSIRLGEQWTVNLGLHGQVFMLHNRTTLEPRAGVRWQFAPNQSLGMAYGLHSRLEQLQYYFTRLSFQETDRVNKELDFTKAHHIVLSYDLNLTNDIHVKVEPYYQYLYHVPVVLDSSFSFMNLENEWFLQQKLHNIGKGENYGIELTVEKYLSDGYYFLFTASVFSSRYQGGDGIWHSTKHDTSPLLNILAGKEWAVGDEDQNSLGLNIRLSYNNGDRVTPYNEAASLAAMDVVEDGARAFEHQLESSLFVHFTAQYRINTGSTSHEFALKILNATMLKEFYGYRYNFKQGTVDEEKEAIIIPNLSYKIEF